MTENKRFLIDDAGELIDLNNHKFVDYGDECCKLLNEQHEQIERLKDNFRALDEVKCELADENEKLKQFQEQVASVIEGKMGDNVCNDYKMEVLKEIWNELELDEVWFE